MRPRIVVFAYACEPGRGSEPGAGWVWARMIAQLGDAWVITRSNNRPVIEAELSDVPERDHLHLVYVDLPDWARWWKRGEIGVRAYYVLWMLLALRAARRLHRTVDFDISWHLTMANVWLGATAAYLPLPFVYGPVGGGVRTSWRLLPSLGLRGAAYELVRSMVRAIARATNPLARRAWQQASVILVQNPETRDWLPRAHQHKARVLPNAVIVAAPRATHRTVERPSPVALFAGNLLPLKGVALAIRALSYAPGWRLVICGKGTDERRLRRLARRLRVEDRVELRGWLPREELFDVMSSEADVFLFPSLHDQSPWVVAEALTFGLPVICLEEGGSTVLGGTGVPRSGVRATAEALAVALVAAKGAQPAPPELDMPSRFEMLRDVLQQHGLISEVDAAPGP